MDIDGAAVMVDPRWSMWDGSRRATRRLPARNGADLPRMLGRRAAVFAATSAVTLVGAAAHAQPVDIVVGHKSASGTHAQAIALGETIRVTKFAVRVTAKPNQRVKGSLELSLPRRRDDRRPRRRQLCAKTPFTVQMRSPRLGTTLYACDLVGSARLSQRGRVTVELLARS